MVASQVACEAIWLRKILMGLFNREMDMTEIYCDNQICIKLSENTLFLVRSKHIDIKYHHLQDCVQRRIMMLQYILIEEQDAYILENTLSRGKFKFHKCMTGVVQNPFLAKRECQKLQKEGLNLTRALVKLSNSIFHISRMTWMAVKLCDMALSTC